MAIEAMIIIEYRYFPSIYGITKPLPSPSFLGGNSNTPPHTKTKAKMVPMLVKSRTKPSLVKRIGTPTINPVIMVANDGVLNFG